MTSPVHSESAIRGLSDSELVAMWEERSQYTCEAVAVAEHELSLRGGPMAVQERAVEAQKELEEILKARRVPTLPRWVKGLAWFWLLFSAAGAAYSLAVAGLTFAPPSLLGSHLMRLFLSCGVLFRSVFCLGGLILILAIHIIGNVALAYPNFENVSLVLVVLAGGSVAVLGSHWRSFREVVEKSALAAKQS